VGSQELAQPDGRFFHPVVREGEGPEVDGQRMAGAECLHGADRIGRREVDARHEPARAKGADRQQRQPWRAQPLPYLFEMDAITRVAREIDGPVGTIQVIACPERGIPIAQAAGREVTGRDGGDRQRLVWRQGLPPVEFLDSRDPRLLQQCGIAQTHDEQGIMGLCQTFQSRQIQMVVVVVAHDHHVDRREILEADARRPHPSGADES